MLLRNGIQINETLYNLLEPIFSDTFDFNFSYDVSLSNNLKSFRTKISNALSDSPSTYIKTHKNELSRIIFSDSILYSYSILLYERSPSFTLGELKKKEDALPSTIKKKDINEQKQNPYLYSLISDKTLEDKRVDITFRLWDTNLLLSLLNLSNPYLCRFPDTHKNSDKNINFTGSPVNFNTFLKSLNQCTCYLKSTQLPKVLASRYTLENMFQFNLFEQCLNNLYEIEHIASNSKLIDDTINNYNYLSLFECPELANTLKKYLDNVQIIKAANSYSNTSEDDIQLKDSAFKTLYKKLENSICFYYNSYWNAIIDKTDAIIKHLDQVLNKKYINIDSLHQLVREHKFRELISFIEELNLDTSTISELKLYLNGQLMFLDDLTNRLCKSNDYDISSANEIGPLSGLLTISRTALFNYLTKIQLNELEQYIIDKHELFKYYNTANPFYNKKLATDTYSKDLYKKCFYSFYSFYNSNFRQIILDNIRDRYIVMNQDNVQVKDIDTNLNIKLYNYKFIEDLLYNNTLNLN